MEKVRLGVVGCGVIGTTHLRAAAQHPGIVVAAVSDLIPERRERAAADYDAAGYPDGETLIREADVDAVVLAMPAGDRIQMPLSALAAGKHVLIEKPAAMSSDWLARYIEAQGDRVAAICSSRYSGLGSTRCAAEVVASGALGPIRSVWCRAIGAAGPAPAAPPPDWRLKRERNAGGILCNWGCYDLDYLMSVTGWRLRPRTVLARTWTIPPQLAGNAAPGSDAETHYAALVLCDDGAVLSVERSEYTACAGEAAWRIVGARGSLRLTMTTEPGKTLYHDEATAAGGVTSSVLWQGDEPTEPLMSGPIHDFAEAILTGRSPRTDLRRAMVIQRITDAIYASAEQGRAIDLD